MAFPLRLRNIKNYSQIASLLLDLSRACDDPTGTTLTAPREQSPETESKKQGEAVALANKLEQMGPTYIKLAQLLSTRPDLLPESYTAALARLQDDVEPIPAGEIEPLVTRELGARLSKLFQRFDLEPLAAASLGQVHRATLRDGRDVVVKVLRPGIRQQVTDELQTLTEVAQFVDQNSDTGRKLGILPMIEELRSSLVRELDYREEAKHLVTLARNLCDFPSICVPEPIHDYTTANVLTMEYIPGIKVTDMSPLRKLNFAGEMLLDELFRAYLKQMLVDGFYHADPHPGNVFLTDDNCLALLDLGMVGRLTPTRQKGFLKLILAISEGDGEAAAQTMTGLGQPMEDYDRNAFTREVADLISREHDKVVQELNAGRVLLTLKQIAAKNGFQLTPEFTMVGKTLMNLDKIATTLAEDFDPNDSIRRHASSIMHEHMLASLSPGKLFSDTLEIKQIAEQLPHRINTILENAANNNIRIKVDAFDQKSMQEGIHKVANRITMGLILAAMIIGATLLMKIPTAFTLLGYPGLAIIFFLIAAVGGLALVINIWWGDRRTQQRIRQTDSLNH